MFAVSVAVTLSLVWLPVGVPSSPRGGGESAPSLWECPLAGSIPFSVVLQGARERGKPFGIRARKMRGSCYPELSGDSDQPRRPGDWWIR